MIKLRRLDAQSIAGEDPELFFRSELGFSFWLDEFDVDGMDPLSVVVDQPVVLVQDFMDLPVLEREFQRIASHVFPKLVGVGPDGLLNPFAVHLVAGNGDHLDDRMELEFLVGKLVSLQGGNVPDIVQVFFGGGAPGFAVAFGGRSGTGLSRNLFGDAQVPQQSRANLVGVSDGLWFGYYWFCCRHC